MRNHGMETPTHPEPWEVAIHEAGHAIVALRLGGALKSVSIVPGEYDGRDSYGGVSARHRKSLNECSPAYAVRRARIGAAVQFAGPLALAFVRAYKTGEAQRGVVEGSDLRRAIAFLSWLEGQGRSFECEVGRAIDRAVETLNEPATLYGIVVLARVLLEYGTVDRRIALRVARGCEDVAHDPDPCDVSFAGIGDGAYMLEVAPQAA